MKNRHIGSSISTVALAVIVSACVHAESNPISSPEQAPSEAAPMMPMHTQTVPSEYETVLFVTDAQGEARAEQLMEIYRVLSTEPSLENVRRHISDAYIQHNPMLPDGPGPLSMLFSQSVSQFPISVDVHKIAIVGDFGMAHVNFRNLDNNDPNDLGTAAVDMYYWGEDGKIIEHWDVLQTVPPQSANPNTMFLMLSEQEDE